MPKYKVKMEWRNAIGRAVVEADSEEQAIELATEECCEEAMSQMSSYSAEAEEVDDD